MRVMSRQNTVRVERAAKVMLMAVMAVLVTIVAAWSQCLKIREVLNRRSWPPVERTLRWKMDGTKGASILLIGSALARPLGLGLSKATDLNAALSRLARTTLG